MNEWKPRCLPSRAALVVFTCALPLLGGYAHAQFPAKRVLLAGENAPLQTRLQTLDDQVALLAGPEDAASIVGVAAATPWASFGRALARHQRMSAWEQWLEEAQQLVQEAGDVLVPPRRDAPGASVRLRRLIDLRLAAAPAAVLKLYRQRVDAFAERLFREGVEGHTRKPLERLVDEYFCSSHTGRALDHLGDLAFEQGRFEEARTWWSRLAATARDIHQPRSGRLLYPGNDVDEPRVRAKMILALAFEGRLGEAREELAFFRRLYPTGAQPASGPFAGREGALDQTVEYWLDRLAERVLDDHAEPWTTFGGTPARNRVLSVCPSPRLWIDGPTWRVRLPTGGEPDELAPKTGPASRVAYHPIVTEQHVVIADARSVIGYHLLTGKEAFRFSLKNAGLDEPPPEKEGRFTLSYADGCVLARLGGQSIGPAPDSGKKATPSFLVSIVATGKEAGRVRWRVEATTPSKKSAVFEGTPLVDGGRVLVAMSRLVGHRLQTALAAYDAETGTQLWWQDVCDAPEFEEHAQPRIRQHLLTLGGGQIYYCSHAGAVVALETRTGKRLWSMRYASRGPFTADGIASPRDLAPAIYAEGRVVVAPLDTDRIFCLDALTGSPHWERQGAEAVHLLGVARGKLIVATPNGLRALSMSDGGDRGGWLQPAEGRLPSLGRGLCAGGWILWPTQDPKLPYRGLTVNEGVQERFSHEATRGSEPDFLEPTMLRGLVCGNLAFGRGVLVSAGLDELVAYVSPRLLLEERKGKLQETKAAPLSKYLLAQAEADAGLTQQSARRFEELTALAGDWGRLGKARLAELSSATRTPRLSEILLDPLKPFTPKETSWRPETPGDGPATIPLERIAAIDQPGSVPILPAPGSMASPIFAFGGSELVARDPTSGEIAWKHPMPWKAAWLDAGEQIVVGAMEGLRGVDPAKGRTLWDLPNPERLNAYVYLDNGTPRTSDGGAFGDFTVAGPWVLTLFDRRLWLAVDRASGRVAWSCWAPGGEMQPMDAGRFHPRLGLGESLLLAQTTSGRVWALDARDGRIVREGPRCWLPWPTAPRGGVKDRFLLPQDGGRVVHWDARTGETLWTFAPEAVSSLTGSPPYLIVRDSTLLAIVPRNLRSEVTRLDLDLGNALWSQSLPFTLDSESLTLDQRAVYFTSGTMLHAHALHDGKHLWRRQLPESAGATGWRTAKVGDFLLAWCEEAAFPWLPIQPAAWTWPAALRALTPVPREKILLVLDPADGAWVQRVGLTSSTAPLQARRMGAWIVASCAGKTWTLR